MKNLFLIFISIGFLGCAFQGSRSDREGIQLDSQVSVYIEPEARSLFSEAEQDARFRKVGQAIAKYDIIRRRWPTSKAAEISFFRIANLLYSSGDYERSIREFESFLKRYPSSSFSFDARYHLAAAHYQRRSYSKAKAALQSITRDQVFRQGSKRALAFFQLQALNAQAQEDSFGAIIALSQQISLVADGNSKKEIYEKIDSLILKVEEAEVLKQIQMTAADLETRKKANQQLTKFSGLVPRDPVFGADPSISAPLELGRGSAGSKRNVGVILPLKGKLAPYGRKALEGILLAARLFEQNQEEKINLFIEDSGSSPVMAAQAVESLVREKGVMAILGPLNSKEGQAVAEKCQQLGVVNISLASKTGISSEGPYVFQTAITPKVQLENLVRFIVQEKGIKRLAVLGPSSAFGRDMADAFWDLVENYGGKISAVEFYNPGATDFQDSIKSMVGLKDVLLRKLEWTALRKFAQEQKEKTGREPKLKLKPIIDFEAVFIPDSPKTLATIAASLAYLDVNNLPLLGILEWNSEELYRRGGEFVEKALFPGVMNSVTRSPGQQEFMRAYFQSYGVPADLLAAQSFESMALVAQGLKKTDSSNRADLARAINDTRNFDNPIGLIQFNDERVAQRSIPLYTLDKRGNFIEQ